MSDPVDCLVIGGGPAGLTAAIYLARFHMSVLVVDSDDSRLALVPRTRNHPGFPAGIAGKELLARMRQQAGQFGVSFVIAEVTELAKEDGVFVGSTSGSSMAGRTALLATGVVNRSPPMPASLHEAALASGRLRYCPICDGYEVTDQAIAVLGTGEAAAREAIFLRGYTRDIALVALDGPHDLSFDQAARLAKEEIEIRDGPCLGIDLADNQIHLRLTAGRRSFKAIYPALGSDVRSHLALHLGAKASEDGCLTVDKHQRTTVEGLYAAGDIVRGLDQISHAMGNGAVAAATIRNDLAERRPFRR